MDKRSDTATMTSSLVSCRWDWCRSSFSSIDALDAHVKHEHIWPMNPMRKADISLMRKMDLRSLHSSQNTGSSIIISRGPFVGVSESRAVSTSPATPPASIPRRPENDEFDTFTQLSSPFQIHSPPKVPESPAFEGLTKQDGYSGLSAAVEMFERTYGHRANQPLLQAHSHSSMLRPLSWSSRSSQEVVEQQLTQEDGADPQSQPILPFSESQIPVDTELRWPTDDESSALASEKNQSSQQLVFKKNPAPVNSPDSTRGQNFHCGSLNISLDMTASLEATHDSEGRHSQSQPFVLQTQAPYSSPTTNWSQTQ